jgi:biotin transport system substrate-specific component
MSMRFSVENGISQPHPRIGPGRFSAPNPHTLSLGHSDQLQPSGPVGRPRTPLGRWSTEDAGAEDAETQDSTLRTPKRSPSMPSSRLSTRDLALVALFAALLAALGLPGTFYLFGTAVPITAQTLGVMLAGSILGARRGFLAVATFVVLVLAGLPLLAGGRGGLGVLAGASAGYFVAFPLGAWVTGWLTEKAMPRYSTLYGFIANVIGGIVVVYAIGIPVQAWRTGTTGVVAAVVAGLVFLPGDLLKAVVATAVAKGVHAGYPTLARDTVRHDGHLPRRDTTGGRPT